MDDAAGLSHRVRLSGPERPGIAPAVLSALATADVALEELGQHVVGGHLVLDLRVATSDGPGLARVLGRVATELGVRLDVDVPPFAGSGDPVPPDCVVTVLATRVSGGALAAVTGAIAGAGADLARIVRLARRPVCAFELWVSGGDASTIRERVIAAAASQGVDVAVQHERPARSAKRLVVLDVDSTLIRDEVIELIADEVGCGAEVAAITARAMAGELDFEASLRARVALLAGADLAALDRAAARVRLTPGARTLVATLGRLGCTVAVVSGGFDHVVGPLAAGLGIDHALANRLEIVDGRLSGALVGPVVDRAGKAKELVRIAELERIPLARTVAVGDGANDLDMLAVAGLGVAFNAKPVVRAAAEVSINVPRLDAILFLLGVPAGEFLLHPDDDEPSVPTGSDGVEV